MCARNIAAEQLTLSSLSMAARGNPSKVHRLASDVVVAGHGGACCVSMCVRRMGSHALRDVYASPKTSSSASPSAVPSVICAMIKS